MELTILLAQVFGIYLLVGGLACILRQQFFMSVVRDFVEHKGLRVIVAIAEFIAGLFLILTHNIWASMPEALVSLMGWILAIEGAFYFLMPDKVIKKIVNVFNKKTWYVGGGVLSIVLGLYLVNFGFGFF